MKHNYTSTLRRALSAVVLLLCVSTLSWAQDFESGGIRYSINEDGESVEVTYHPVRLYSGDIVIPSTVSHEGKTYSVTGIGDGAFEGCFSLTSISLPESVTSIRDYAFDGCQALNSIDIPESVTNIGKETFFWCSSLTSVDIPSGVKSIGGGAFASCSSLTSMTVAAGNPVYDSREGCNAIIETGTNKLIAGCRNTVIPSSVKSIEYCAFRGCSYLTSVDIPESVTDIGEYAFYECSSLTSVDIPSGVTSIGDKTFAFCTSLASISIPEGVTRIGDETFKDCRSLTSISLPSGFTDIGRKAFDQCSSLASIFLPSSVTSIGGQAFQDCTSLASIDIPSSVTSIGRNAFYNCRSLAKMTVSADNQVYDSREGCNAIIETKTNTLVVGCKSTVIPSSVTSIGDYAFSGCSFLTSIDIPSGVTSIGELAFCGCTSLTFIDIPSSVTSIGYYAFGDCTSIISVICRAEEVPVCDYGVFDGTPIDKATVYVPASSINAYRAADGWKDFGTILSLEEYETGIDAPSALQPDEVADAAAPYYTIGGQRVNAPVRGHIYIRSGRKVIY